MVTQAKLSAPCHIRSPSIRRMKRQIFRRRHGTGDVARAGPARTYWARGDSRGFFFYTDSRGFGTVERGEISIDIRLPNRKEVV